MKAMARIVSSVHSSGLTRDQRRAVANRGPSRNVKGSGVPSRAQVAASVFAIALFALLALAPLSQGKVVVNAYGPFGGLGGQSQGASEFGLAFDSTGAGAPAGSFYLAEGNRMQRFTPTGGFGRIWGNNVVKPGGTGDKGGGNEFEICSIASECQQIGGAGFFNGGPTGMSVSPTNGKLYTFEPGTRRVMVFDANGNIVRVFGWDVVSTGKPNDVGTNAFEVCDMEAGNVLSDCKAGGVTGVSGGQFGGFSNSNAGELIVDSSEHVWVADGANRRIQEFSLNGAFLGAYGWDVVPAGKAGNVPGNEEQTVTLNPNATGGSYKLRFGGTAPANTSAPIAFGASAAEVQTALEGITALGAGNVSVAGPNGGPYVVTFQGAKADTDVAEITADNSGLIGTQTITLKEASGNFALSFGGQTTGATGTGNFTSGSSVVSNVSTTNGAFAAGQIITSTSSGIQSGTSIEGVNVDGPNTLTLSKPLIATKTGAALKATDIPSNASAATVQSKLAALSTIGVGNVSVSGVAGGPYTITFTGTLAGSAQPVIVADGAGFTTGSISVLGPQAGVKTTRLAGNLEKCTSTAVGDCRAGREGSDPGQFSANQPADFAFDESGNLFAIDAGNNRVQKFDPTLLSSASASVPLPLRSI